MKSYVQITVRTKIDTADWLLGERFISFLEGTGKLAPEYVSHNSDRVSEPFLGKSSCEHLWASKALLSFKGTSVDFYQDFAWRRKKALRSSGSIVHTSRNGRGQIVPGTVSLTAEYNSGMDWSGLFEAWCLMFRPQLGMLHVFTDPELRPSERNNSFQLGSFDSALNPTIQNSGWGMFYGDEFAQDVDVDRILEDGFFAKEMNGGFLVRVTKGIQDVVDDFSGFSVRRSKLKELFPKRFFSES